ncbi:MAG: hypothetical protein PHU85_08060 [Phycisphaerae bacterium]|nr:hypothetical protein [Phycisphaerae bacterium]
MSETYILCEGYHDRAFWDGLLRRLGCADPGLKADGTRTIPRDPWGLFVRGSGEHAFESRSKAFIRVVPTGGKNNVLRFARRRLADRSSQKALPRMVLSVDSDVNVDGSPNPAAGVVTDAAVADLAREFDAAAVARSADEYALDNGATLINVIRWTADDPVAAGLPIQNALERLICASILAVHPERAEPVHRWLLSRPAPPPSTGKEFAWSYVAGWYADRGDYEAFCSTLWDDPAIADQLMGRLKVSGALAIAEAIAS